ncbi:MAG: DUF4286 family protein [Muribaculaceae bacterium]|jgi:hypothetical protein|nr:DUF4286 family protein [Muribaculaceae bacterium]
MILLNTTFSIDASAADAFKQYIIEEFVPRAEKAGMYNILLTGVRDRETQPALAPSRTFALQFRAPSQQVYDEFAAHTLPLVTRYIKRKWAGKIAMFDTVLDVVHDHNKTAAND